jgi:hypothetical protein
LPSVDGTNTTVLTVCESDTVRTLKNKVGADQGIDPKSIVLNYKGKPLTNDNSTLAELQVTNNSIVFISRRFKGGSI